MDTYCSSKSALDITNIISQMSGANQPPKCCPSNNGINMALEQASKSQAQTLRALVKNANIQKILSLIQCEKNDECDPHQDSGQMNAQQSQYKVEQMLQESSNKSIYWGSQQLYTVDSHTSDSFIHLDSDKYIGVSGWKLNRNGNPIQLMFTIPFGFKSVKTPEFVIYFLTNYEIEEKTGSVDFKGDLIVTETGNDAFLPWSKNLDSKNSVELVEISSTPTSIVNKISVEVSSASDPHTLKSYRANMKVPTSLPTFMAGWLIHLAISRLMDNYIYPIYIVGVEFRY